MKRRRNTLFLILVTITVVLIALRAIEFFSSPVAKPPQLGYPQTGTKLYFKLAIQGMTRAIPSWASDGFQDIDAQDYNYLVRTSVSQTTGGVNSSESIVTPSCAIGSAGLGISVAIVSQVGRWFQTLITLTFTDGIASCEAGTGELPQITGTWQMINGYSVARFNELNLTENVQVDADTDDVIGSNGQFSGVWPLWLDSWQLSQNTSLLAYGLFDDVLTNLPVKGVANIVPLNLTQTAPSDSDLNGLTVTSSSQIFSDMSLLPTSTRILNVSAASLSEVISNKLGQDRSCRLDPYCNARMEHTAFNSFNSTRRYSNGTLVFDNSVLQNTRILSNYCTYADDSIVLPYNMSVNGAIFSAQNQQGAVICEGQRYLASGFNFLAGLENVSFSRASGILLQITVTSLDGDLAPILPGPIMKIFGIQTDPLFAGTTVAMELTDARVSLNEG